jgi:hypothetical protein
MINALRYTLRRAVWYIALDDRNVHGLGEGRKHESSVGGKTDEACRFPLTRNGFPFLPS